MAAENEKMEIDSLASQTDEVSPEVDSTEHSEAVNTDAAEQSQSQAQTAACDSVLMSKEPSDYHIETETCPTPEPAAKTDCVIGDDISAGEKCEVVPSDTSNQGGESSVSGSGDSPSLAKLEADAETNGASIMLSEVAGEPTDNTGSSVSRAIEETVVDESAIPDSEPQPDVIEDVHDISDELPAHSTEGPPRVRKLKHQPRDTQPELTTSSSDIDDEDTDEDIIDDLADDGDPMMGHYFNEDDRLCDRDGKPFVFNYYKAAWKNQLRYERIGEAITEKIYDLLEQRCKLRKKILPLNAKEDEPHSFIFLSENALTTTDRLLILIHGSGVVRAGQWARRLIINDDLNKGTQIPYIERAIEEGYQVMVLNTNRNNWPDGDMHASLIPENSDPESHAAYVWEKLIKPSEAKHLAIVAHSYGGVVTTNLLEEFTEEFKKRVFAVAFTDSVHSVSYNSDVSKFYKKNARNYVTSDLPLGEPVSCRYDFGDNAERVSAGHLKHEWTSCSSIDSVFQYLQEKYVAKTAPSSPPDKCCTT